MPQAVTLLQQQWNAAPMANHIVAIQSPYAEFVSHFCTFLLSLSEFLGKETFYWHFLLAVPVWSHFNSSVIKCRRTSFVYENKFSFFTLKLFQLENLVNW